MVCSIRLSLARRLRYSLLFLKENFPSYLLDVLGPTVLGFLLLLRSTVGTQEPTLPEP